MKRLRHGAYVGNKEQSEHSIWRTMIARCTRPTDKDYGRYGARGISVCTQWNSYEAFIRDMGARPSIKHSLDRVDTDGPYSPENCKWSTHSEQQKNKTTTRWYSNGEFVGTLVECAALLNMSKELAYWRFKNWGTFQRGAVWQERRKPL